jgi:hypothetical protein
MVFLSCALLFRICHCQRVALSGCLSRFGQSQFLTLLRRRLRRHCRGSGGTVVLGRGGGWWSCSAVLEDVSWCRHLCDCSGCSKQERGKAPVCCKAPVLGGNPPREAIIEQRRHSIFVAAGLWLWARPTTVGNREIPSSDTSFNFLTRLRICQSLHTEPQEPGLTMSLLIVRKEDAT